MRSIELFSGAGGMALGLEQAGFDTVGFYEHDKHACTTLRANRPLWNVVEEDVRNVDFRSLHPVELVAGGPPCQPFSMGGKARGLNDPRDMFPQAVRAVRELEPKAFIFENVRGLLRPAFADYVEFIRLQLTYPGFPVSENVDWDQNLRRLQRHHTLREKETGLRYKVTVHLADAADYGVPQRRLRVFFVGIRADLNAGWTFPVPSHSLDELLREQFVTGNYWLQYKMECPPVPLRFARKIAEMRQEPIFRGKERWQTIRDTISDLPEPDGHCGVPNHLPQSGAKAYPGHTGSPLDEPAKALKAGDHGVPGGENMLRHANGKVRYFTVREAARIQTFPDGFFFPGSWTENMRQLGNAVPVRLAQVVASSVAFKICSRNRNVCQKIRKTKS